MKIMSGDLFVSQNPRSTYASVQILRADNAPNSNQINIRFETKWTDRKGIVKSFLEYRQNIKVWIFKNDATRHSMTEACVPRTHVIGYVPDTLSWNNLEPSMTGLYRQASPLGWKAVVLEADHAADMAAREVLIADLYSRIGRLRRGLEKIAEPSGVRCVSKLMRTAKVILENDE